MTSSPKFKNLGIKPKQSPIEIKEKMRKNYKNKVQNCRGMLLDKLRGSTLEKDLFNTLTEIYKSMFNFSNDTYNYEEHELMEELKNEFIQAELEWLLKEHERSQMDNVDWSSMEEDNNVICPICQKGNIQLNECRLNCTQCNISINTDKSLPDVKNTIFLSLESHNAVCTSDAQFGVLTEMNDTHIYLTCDTCSDVKLVF